MYGVSKQRQNANLSVATWGSRQEAEDFDILIIFNIQCVEKRKNMKRSHVTTFQENKPMEDAERGEE